MFKITSKQAISWASFRLEKGANEFTSRAAVPAELWTKLARFRELGILEFEAEFDDKTGKLVEHPSDKVLLEELTERHLYQMDKGELTDLAKANGVTVAPNAEGALKKKDLLDALVAKLPQPLPEASSEATKPAETAAGKKPSKVTPAAPASPVSLE